MLRGFCGARNIKMGGVCGTSKVERRDVYGTRNVEWEGSAVPEILRGDWLPGTRKFEEHRPRNVLF
jgi:hypothetical protein